MTPIRTQARPTTQPLDIEQGQATAPENAPSRGSARRLATYALGAAALGGIATGVALYVVNSHHKIAPAPAPQPHAPALAPQAHAPQAFAPQAHAPSIAPAPAPARLVPPPAFAPAPAPANNNATGSLGMVPFTMQKKTGMYLASPIAGGQKFAIVLTDADETCQTLSVAPTRSTGIQELDLCQVSNGTAIVAQNGRIIQNGQQYQSTSMSLNGAIDANSTLSGHFTLNSTNNGFVTGAFSAEPCDTLVFSNFCDLQN